MGSIIGADLTAAGVPLVGSAEIPWIAHAVDPTDTNAMAEALKAAWDRHEWVVRANAEGLRAYTAASREAWALYLNQGVGW